MAVRFARFGFGGKLGFAFGTLLTLAIVLGLTGLWSIERIVPLVAGMYEEEVLPITYLSTIEATWYEIRLNEYKHYFGEEGKVYNDARRRIISNLGIIDSLTELYRRIPKTSEELQLLKEYLLAVAAYNGTREPFFQLSEKSTKKEAYTYLMGPSKDARSAVMRTITALIKQQTKSAQSKYSIAQQFSQKVKTWQLLLTLIVVGAGIAFAVSITRSLTKRVVALAHKADTIARGDLTQRVQETSNDEIGTLMRRFDAMVENLRTTLLHVVETTTTVANASAKIMASTEEMAAGAIEQSSQAMDVSRSVEELVAATHHSAGIADTTARSAQEAFKAADRGTATVTTTIDRMDRIAHVVKISSERVEELGKSSDEIGEIVGLIDDIADQTNLLALNAAIEAARAGEDGRGFAVVADEVRRLAERTSQATKNISEMIRKIQNETKEAVAAMKKGTIEVAEGIQFAEKARYALQEIKTIAEKVATLNTQITDALSTQTDVGIAMKQKVERIAAVTNETANGTQQIAKAAEDLNRLIENLNVLLNQFRITTLEQPQKKENKALHSVK